MISSVPCRAWIDPAVDGLGFTWSYTPVQSIVSEREITPSSSAAIAVIGLKVEPGALIAWVALLYSGLDISLCSLAK